VHSLIETAKLNVVNPQAWLAEVLGRIAHHPVNRVDEFLSWNLAGQIAGANRAELIAA